MKAPNITIRAAVLKADAAVFGTPACSGRFAAGTRGFTEPCSYAGPKYVTFWPDNALGGFTTEASGVEITGEEITVSAPPKGPEYTGNYDKGFCLRHGTELPLTEWLTSTRALLAAGYTEGGEGV